MIKNNVLGVLTIVAVVAMCGGLVHGDYQKWSTQQEIEHGSAEICDAFTIQGFTGKDCTTENSKKSWKAYMNK